MPNDSAKIILAVTNGKLSKVRDTLAVEGTINALKVEFQFRTQDWNDTTKTAVFVRGRATPSTTNADITYVILDDNNECDVPAEILAKDGMFSVGIFGTRDDYRIVSNWMCYRVADGCYADGSTPIDPSSTVYEQIISMLNNKSEIEHNHDERYYTKDESDYKYLIQSDWSQNDNTARDYIKNRTHYKYDIREYICFDGELSFNETRTIPMEIEIPVGTTIKTYFGSEVFTSTVVLDNDGDLNASNGLFNIFFRNGGLDVGNYYMGGNVKIVAENFALVTPLDERYIPNSIARMSKSTTITLTATMWQGTTSPYWQRVSMQGLTSNSMITIHPTPEQLAELQDAEITLMIANDNGVVTAYSINSKPTKDYTMQVLITEVQSI